MPSALSRSFSVPINTSLHRFSLMAKCCDPLDPTATSNKRSNNTRHRDQEEEEETEEEQQQIDPKAVGSHLAHRPLSRRRSNPLNDGSLFADSLTLLNNKLNQTSLLQMAVNASLTEAKRNGHHHRKLDRSQSEPVDPIRGGVIPANSSRYKTELCRPYEENGTCKYGDKCQFAHGVHELRSLVRHPKYKTELCRTFHTIGFCPYGPRCHFIHNAEEARIHNNNIDQMRLAQGEKLAGRRNKFAGSTAESPSPPSSLSESPTSMSTFFSDDLFHPFSPAAPVANNNAFLFGGGGGGGDFATSSLFSSQRQGDTIGQQYSTMGAYHRGRIFDGDMAVMHDKLAELQGSPSPVDSLSSDLDSLSLASASPPPPSCSSSSSSSSNCLRLPIFSRISETLNED